MVIHATVGHRNEEAGNETHMAVSASQLGVAPSTFNVGGIPYVKSARRKFIKSWRGSQRNVRLARGSREFEISQSVMTELLDSVTISNLVWGRT